MKALIGTAAVVVISTCGYFVYEDISMKARMEYLQCQKELVWDKKNLFDGYSDSRAWEAQTTEMRLEALRRLNNGNILADSFERNWEECGPV